MKTQTAKLFLEAARTLEDLEIKMTRQVLKLEELPDDTREDDDVFDDLIWMRDEIKTAREDMEHRIADAEEELS